MMALLANGTRGLGYVSVKGRRRVPKPAATRGGGAVSPRTRDQARGGAVASTTRRVEGRTANEDEGLEVAGHGASFVERVELRGARGESERGGSREEGGG